MFNNFCIFLTTFMTYTTFNLLALKNSFFSKSITPQNFKGGHDKSHEIVAYGMSTIHSIIVGIFNSLNILGLIDNQTVYTSYYFSFGYFCGDILYLFLISKTKKELLNQATFLFHHLIVIMGLITELSYQNDIIVNKLRYYTGRMFLAELSVIPMNIAWFIKNIDVDYKKNYYYRKAFEAFFRLYIVFRIINYSHLSYMWYTKEVEYIVEGITLVFLSLLNFIWFYKICQIKIGLNKIEITNKIQYKMMK
jgi:hypothetical protein